MKKRVLATFVATALSMTLVVGCAGKKLSGKEAADNCAALIDAIYVQERTDKTDKQCEEAKAAWDALTDEEKEMVEGEGLFWLFWGRKFFFIFFDENLLAIQFFLYICSVEVPRHCVGSGAHVDDCQCATSGVVFRC